MKTNWKQRCRTCQKVYAAGTEHRCVNRFEKNRTSEELEQLAAARKR